MIRGITFNPTKDVQSYYVFETVKVHPKLSAVINIYTTEENFHNSDNPRIDINPLYAELICSIKVYAKYSVVSYWNVPTQLYHNENFYGRNNDSDVLAGLSETIDHVTAYALKRADITLC